MRSATELPALVNPLAPAGTPEILLAREPLENGLFRTFGAPDASSDCSTLYVVSLADDGSGIAGQTTYSIDQLRR